MSGKQTKIIVTIGPATNTEQALRKIKDKGVDFVRVNMSHSSLEDLETSIAMARKVGIPFIIDTEGSQIRTGDLETDTIHFKENEQVEIHSAAIAGSREKLCLKPGYVVEQLEVGDLIHIDFDTLILRVTDVSTASDGYIAAKTITGGLIGRNKAVVVDPVFKKRFHLPPPVPQGLSVHRIGLEVRDRAHSGLLRSIRRVDR